MKTLSVMVTFIDTSLEEVQDWTKRFGEVEVKENREVWVQDGDIFVLTATEPVMEELLIVYWAEWQLNCPSKQKLEDLTPEEWEIARVEAARTIKNGCTW